MHLDEYMSLDAMGLAELVERKQVTPAELLALARQRADAVPWQRETLTRIQASPASASIGFTRKNEPGEMSTFFWRAAT